MRTTLSILTWTLALALSVSCTKKASQDAVPLNKALFGFEYLKSRSLTLAKTDPATGDHWMVRVERQQEKPGTFYENDPWLIQSYSESANLRDKLANRILILHLMDTLGTLQATGTVQANDPEDSQVRASYGLAPPRYALRWEAWDPKSEEFKSFSLEIGNITDPKSGMSESFASFPPSTEIYKVNGAAMAMLGYIRNFNTMRQENISPMAADDVDQIEIYENGKKTLSALRDGDHWSVKRKDISGFLERLTHLRIQRFIDSEDEAEPLHAYLEKHSSVRIVLKDRASRPTEFSFAQIKGRTISAVSTRGNAVLELYPEAFKNLKP